MPEVVVGSLVELVEELADAHLDTLALALTRDLDRAGEQDREWALHLAYVQDLCRATHGVLAHRRAA